MSQRYPSGCVLALLLAALLLPLLPAQPPTARKHALLVGVNKYQHEKLPDLDYAEADVTELAKLLNRAGYRVTLLTGATADKALQPTRANIEEQLQAVLHGCKKGDTVVVAFAGHGLQFEKQKESDADDAYFCPLDARPFRDERATLVSLTGVYRGLEKSFAGMKVLLVDACRNDPDPNRGAHSGISADSGLRLPVGVAALFSCKAREKAYEHKSLGHGVFFYHVLQGLRGEAKDKKGRVTFAGLAAYVTQEVADADSDKGVPKLIGGGALQSPQMTANYSAEPVLVALSEVERVTAQKPALLRAPFSQATARAAQQAWAEHLGRKVEEEIDLGNGVTMRFVLIPPGTFIMGSPQAEKDRFDNEEAHEVTISRAFYLGKYEVKRGQFRRFVEEDGYRTEAETDGLGGYGYDQATGKLKGPTFDPKTGTHKGGKTTTYSWRNLGFEQTDSHPVLNVTWNDAQAFGSWLAKRGMRKAGLPSEAEWEWACRAGVTTRYHFGDDSEGLARYGNVADGTAKKKFPTLTTMTAEDGYVFTAPVGLFGGNPFGLYDMHGNAFEWCQDWYGPYQGLGAKDPLRANKSSDNARVLRSGSWYVSPGRCRAARRYGRAPVFRDADLGFRVAFRLD